MRAIIIIVVVLVIIFTGSIASANFLQSSSGSMNQELKIVYEKVKSKEWDKAHQQLQLVDEKWGKIKDSWAVFLDHQEIDNIELSLSKMREYVKNGDKIQSLAEISLLKLLFEHIPEKEKFSFKNIF